MDKQEINDFLKNEEEVKDLLSIYLGNKERLNVFYPALNAVYKTKTVAFNVWSFLFTVCYLTYYKLYFEALVIMLFSFVASTLIKTHEILSFASIAISIFCGLSFFKFYFKVFFKRLKKAGYGTLDLKQVKENLKEKGGIDKTAYAIFAAVILVQAFSTHINEIFKQAPYP